MSVSVPDNDAVAATQSMVVMSTPSYGDCLLHSYKHSNPKGHAYADETVDSSRIRIIHFTSVPRPSAASITHHTSAQSIVCCMPNTSTA
jgi:hypothetical protein